MVTQNDSMNRQNTDGYETLSPAKESRKQRRGPHLTDAAQNDRDSFIRAIFAAIASEIDFLSSFFSFGLDQGWRKRLVALLDLKGGEQVLDVCTGTGKLALLLAAKVGEGGSVLGVDFSRECCKKPAGSLVTGHLISGLPYPMQKSWTSRMILSTRSPYPLA
jgi:2-polyprenyl-3-methyl-5-hydroxy-6-metoxy-1,4-benzoquinol methylase